MAERACQQCGGSLPEGSSPQRRLCDRCRAARRAEIGAAEQRRRRARRLSEGRCICGRELEDGRRTCAVCRERVRLHRQALIGAGLCGCGRDVPVPGRQLCRTCLDYKRRRRAA